ncbi:MAG: diguanylate cyclase domain-containing protein, partial [Acidimicrobiales bacterium]
MAILRAHIGISTYTLAGIAIIVTGLLVAFTDDPLTSWRQDDALLVGLFFVVGMLVIERSSLVVEGERQTHTVSIAEMLLVLGAVYLSPLVFIGLRVGVGTLFMVDRRTFRRKMYFNLSLFAMEAALLSYLVRLVLSEFPSSLAAWAWVAAACSIMSLATLAWVSLVISLHERHHSFAIAARSQGFAVLVGSSWGVVIASSGASVAAVVLFSMPVIAGIAWLFRAYGDLSQGHQELESCYQFSRDLAAMPFLDDVIDETLQQSRAMLRGDTARLVVLAAPDGSRPVEYVFDGKTRSHAVPLDDLSAWVEFLGETEPKVVVAESLSGDARAAFDSRDIQGALISSVESRGLSALLIITDRLGRRGVDFTDRDRDLFAHVTSNAAAQLSVGYVLRELEDSTLKDGLTGLGNRRRFENHLEDFVDRETNHAVFLVDLVGLENVNDTLGHDSGESVVVEIGRRLTEIAGPGWELSRFQSGEFAIAVPYIENEGVAMNLVQRVQEVISRPLELDGTKLEVSSQVGIAFFPEHGHDIHTVIRRADIAAESAKFSPTSRLIYSSEIDDRSPRRLAMARELRVAIEKGHLEVYYQPKALLSTGEVIGVEALCRWSHPTLGFIPPDEFIEVAERTHLIGPLTELVM